LRKLSLQSDVHIYYYIGHFIDINIAYIHLGLEMNNLLDIYYGRHFLCFFINETVNIHFFSGFESIFEETYTMSISLNLRLYLGYSIYFHQSNLFSGDLLIEHLNITTDYASQFIDSIYYLPKFIYLLGYELDHSLLSISTNYFCVYQGHHADIGVINSNLLLPSMTYLEKKGFYMDCFGCIEYSAAILVSVTNYYNDITIIYSLLKYTLKKPFELVSLWGHSFFYTNYVTSTLEYLKKKLPSIACTTIDQSLF
jgi:hypothetical protein